MPTIKVPKKEAAGMLSLVAILTPNPKYRTTISGAAVTLTLLIPCVAQLQFMFKERGAKNAIAIATFVVFFAFSLGYLLNQLLTIMELSF